MKVNTARSTNFAKLSKFANMRTSFFSPSVSPNFFTLFLDGFFGLLCFRFRLTGVSSIILFRARTLVVLRHGVLANWLVECFSLVVPNMVISKLNIQKLVSQHTRGRYTFQPLWVSVKYQCQQKQYISSKDKTLTHIQNRKNTKELCLIMILIHISLMA